MEERVALEGKGKGVLIGLDCYPNQQIIPLTGSFSFIVPWPHDWPVALGFLFPEILYICGSCPAVIGMVVSFPSTTCKVSPLGSSSMIPRLGKTRQCLSASTSMDPFCPVGWFLGGAPIPVFACDEEIDAQGHE